MRRAAVVLALGVAVTACGGGSPATDAADRTFLQDMRPHHAQAIAAGHLAETRGSDPRVRAFGMRIVTEQQPELDRMDAAVTAAHLTLDPAAGAAMAVHRISATELESLATLTGPAFDRRFLADSIASETGAVAMAQPEVAGGHDARVVAIARPIAAADAPGSEIPQLQALLVSIG